MVIKHYNQTSYPDNTHIHISIHSPLTLEKTRTSEAAMICYKMFTCDAAFKYASSGSDIWALLLWVFYRIKREKAFLCETTWFLSRKSSHKGELYWKMCKSYLNQYTHVFKYIVIVSRCVTRIRFTNFPGYLKATVAYTDVLEPLKQNGSVLLKYDTSRVIHLLAPYFTPFSIYRWCYVYTER